MYGSFYHDDEVSESGGGIVFEPYKASDLADKIEQVYYMTEEERRQYGIRGREYIKNNHSVEILADKMLKVLFQ